MPSKNRISQKKSLDIVVKGINLENKHKEKIKITFKCSDGEYDIFLTNKEAKKKGFFPGQRYKGYFGITSSPDFPGDNPETMTVATCYYILETIKTHDGVVIYNKKD
jgi:hypothetical protein